MQELNGQRNLTMRLIKPGFACVKRLNGVESSPSQCSSTQSYSRLGEGYMNATWYWSKTTTDTRNKLRQGSDPWDFSSVGCNPPLLLVLLLAENLIKIIERGNIDEISQELTPKALAKCGRNALLVAMEVFWRNLSQCLNMNSQFTFSLTYVQRSVV